MTRFNRLITSLSAVAVLVLMAQGSPAHGNDRGQAKTVIGGAHVSVDYGRPSLRGRDPLKMLEPGQLWRLGSDASTTIELDQNLIVGGARVMKGKHILLVRYVEPGKWTLVVSDKPATQYEPSAKLAEVPMTLAEANDSVEDLALKLSGKGDGGMLDIEWGKMRLSAPFTVAK